MVKIRNNLIINKSDLSVELDKSVLNAVFYKDLNGVYIYCNKEFCDYLGMTTDQIIGKKHKDIYRYNEKLKIFEEKDKEVILYKLNQSYKTKIETKNNKIKYIEITKTPMLNDKNEICGIMGIVKDSSDSLYRYEEIEKLKDDFFSNLYHELGTPINSIMTSLQLLNLNINSEENLDIEKIKNINDIMKKNMLRLLKITNNLVYVTKLDSNNVKCNFKVGDIVSFIEDICIKTSEFCKRKDMSLTFDTNKEIYIGEFDKSIIEKILLNLLSNSIKYNKKNGKIKVELVCKSKYILIKVQDNGLGIPTMYIKYIFEKLTYVDDRLTKSNEGSGLGLYITKELVDIYGGNIDVNTSFGEGSEFIIKLPFNKVNENQKIYKTRIVSGLDPISIEFSDIY